jgi:predicted RNA binding protein YcfA (HicA-like mRNA interferase family)
LQADGWYLKRTRGSHHQFVHPTKVGTITVPHPKKDLGKGLLLTILKQAGLGLLDDGKPFPAPSQIEQLQKKRSYRGWTWAVVDIDASELGDKVARINITLPQRILRAVDAHAKKQGETRSGFLARAALDAMRKQA